MEGQAAEDQSLRMLVWPPHAVHNVPTVAVKLQADVRPAVVTIAQPAVEARPIRIPLQCPHAVNTALKVAVKLLADVRPVAGITAQLAAAHS